MQQSKDIELFALQTHLFYLTNFSLLQKQEIRVVRFLIIPRMF
jgi:hypothetical protein